MKNHQIQKKIWDRHELSQKIQTIPANQQIVFTNGCFDIIHAGHIDYLEKAAQLGDFFIVAINSDDSVRRLEKSPARPLQSEFSRTRVMASFSFVDAVVIFDEDTPKQIIETITPDILVKGGDYKRIEDIEGHDCVAEAGGSTYVLDYVDGCSTTNLIKNIRNTSDKR